MKQTPSRPVRPRQRPACDEVCRIALSGASTRGAEAGRANWRLVVDMSLGPYGLTTAASRRIGQWCLCSRECPTLS
jgi:hypothetical protein